MVVEDGGGTRIECFEEAGELAVEDVLRCVVVALHIAGGHVLEETFIGVSAFELCLPDMVMSVNEAGGDDLGGAVDDLGVGWEAGESSADLSDDVIFQEDVGVRSTDDVVVSIVNQGCAVA